jgi:branched-chain amino acid transport system permease protein
VSGAPGGGRQRGRLGRWPGFERTALLVVAFVLLTGPVWFTRFTLNGIITRGLILGLLAATMAFLYRYCGVLSLAQVGIFGVAGFMFGNLVTQGETKGLNLGWEPWLAVVVAVLAATAVALVFGLVAARSAGIYFMMITLVFAVIVYYFFGQVQQLSGFGGLSNLSSYMPWPIGPTPNVYKLYYTTLLVSAGGLAAMRYVLRTPFGLAAQGVRDDPVRMAALGFDVPTHRALAFTFAGAVAALAGILFVWWNEHIDPATVNLGASLDLVVIAVLGGMSRLRGAWIGAFFFVAVENLVRNIPAVSDRFHTVIGLVFLAIVVVSPDGLLGIADRGARLLRRLPRFGARPAPPQARPLPHHQSIPLLDSAADPQEK